MEANKFIKVLINFAVPKKSFQLKRCSNYRRIIGSEVILYLEKEAFSGVWVNYFRI